MESKLQCRLNSSFQCDSGEVQESNYLIFFDPYIVTPIYRDILIVIKSIRMKSKGRSYTQQQALEIIRWYTVQYVGGISQIKQ